MPTTLRAPALSAFTLLAAPMLALLAAPVSDAADGGPRAPSPTPVAPLAATTTAAGLADRKSGV